MDKRLYKSQRDKVIFGVCGGLGEYFSVDAVVIRLLVVIFAFTGAGLIAYIAAAIIIPENPSQWDPSFGNVTHEEKFNNQSRNTTTGNTAVILGIICIGIGIAVLARFFLPWIDTAIFGALAFICLGIFFLARKK